MVATIVVVFYFYVRLCECAFLRKLELYVFDVQTTLKPHRLVVGSDAQYALCALVEVGGMIKVVGSNLYFQHMLFNNSLGAVEPDLNVGL